MNINKVSKPDSEYSVYEIADEGLMEPVYYLAINNNTHLVNIYALDSEGKSNDVDLTVLKFRTDLPLNYNAKEHVLTFSDNDKLDQLLVDLLGEYSTIVSQDLGLHVSDETEAEVELSLAHPEPKTDEIDSNKYNPDPYAGLEPEVIDVLKQIDGESESGEFGVDEFGNEISPEEVVPEEEEIPPEEETEAK